MELLHTEVHQEAGWAVVDLRGQIDVGTAPGLRQELQALSTRGHHRLVLDLRGVEYLDSFGVGVIMGAVRRARNGGGDLALVCGDAPVREVLEVAGLDRMLPLHASVAAALEGTP